MKQIKRKRITGLGLLVGAMVTGVGLFGSVAAPVRAQTSLGNQEIRFSEDTTVEFEFKESHGAFQSALGVQNLDTGERTVLFGETKPYDDFGTGKPQVRSPGQNNTGTAIDFLGTVQGGTVQNRLSEFTFKANNRYAFYLESVSPTGQTRRVVVSTNDLATAFDGSLDSGNRSGIVGSRIAWDDDGEKGKDSDFDDFVVEAGGYLIEVNCPPVR